MTTLLNNSFKDMDRVRRFVTEEEFARIEAGIISGKYIVVPSFVDVHVHFREPGFLHILLTEVPYFLAILPKVSPFFTVW